MTAGLVADGLTEIRAIHHIDRGYEDLTGKLSSLGASVTRTGPDERTFAGAEASPGTCGDDVVRGA